MIRLTIFSLLPLCILVNVAQSQFVAEVDIPSGDPLRVHTEGNYDYMVNGYSGVYVVDIRRPFQAKLISEYKTNGRAEDIWVRDRVAYVPNGREGLTIIDFFDFNSGDTWVKYRPSVT